MIIGNNGNSSNNNFNNKSTFINNNFTKNNNFEERKQPIDNNVFTKNIHEFEHTNPTNNNDMYDKSLAMLNERLKNGDITMEEFNSKCQQLGKKRQNSLNNKNNF